MTLTQTLGETILNYKYSYPVARARGMRRHLLTDKQLATIIDSRDLEGSLDILNSTAYGSILAETPTKGFAEMEQALNKNLIGTLLKIHRFLPNKVNEIFYWYLVKYEAANLKTILRGVFAKVPKDEIINNLLPMSLNIKKSVYEDLAGMSNIEEIVSSLDSTIFGPALTKTLPEYEKSGLLLQLETALDRFAYENLWKKASNFKGTDVEFLKKAIGIEIDILNLKILIRSKVEDIKPEEVSKYLIPNAFELKIKKLASLSKLEEVDAIVNALENTIYYKPLEDGIEKYKKTGELSPFERALDSYYSSLAFKLQQDQPQGMGPIWRYIMDKTTEIRNLILILKLKEEDFTPEEIKSLV
ncbi:MAG: ATP synthase A1 subunit C [Candidatus Hydrothermarchaeales archaeon]